MVQKCLDRNELMRNPDKPKAPEVRSFAWFEQQAELRRKAALERRKHG